MSDLFACPHCGAEYPRKPVLVGKVVRCTKCRNPFKLRPDGIADAVVESPSSAITAAADAKPESAPTAVKAGTQTIAVTPSLKPATARVARTEATDQPEPNTASAPHKPSTGWTALEGLSDKPPPAPVRTRMQAAAALAPESANSASDSAKIARKDFTAKQEEARRAMSAKLNSAMSRLQPEASAPAPPAGPERIDPLAPLAPVKKGATSRRMKTDSGRKAAPVAVLSGEGEREGRQQRMILGICAVVLVLALVAWGILAHEGPLDQTLTRFATAAPDAVFPERTLIIQRRCVLWSTVAGGQPSDPFEGLRDRHFSDVRTITRDSIADALGRIAGMTLIDHQKVWVDQAHAQDATTLLAGLNNPGPDDIIAALGRAGIKCMLATAFAEKLTAAGIDGEGQAVLLALLAGETERGTTGTTGTNAIGAHLLSGDVPQKIEWLVFSGDHGDFLRYDGFHYKYQDRKYRGHLVRFSGAKPDWPTAQDAWKVMDVNVTGP
jgi:hypothetical protein